MRRHDNNNNKYNYENRTFHQDYSRYSERSTRANTRSGFSFRNIPHYITIPCVGMMGSMVVGYWYFLEEAPFTKRKRLLATSLEWERYLGDQEYKNLIKQYRKDILPPQHRASITVQRVGSRIAAASSKFAQDTKHPELATGSPYTYTVIRSDMANAFVLPNNHVFVLTGLFKYVRNEDELAAVIGHEIAHNLARHAGERMSGSLLISLLARFTLLLDPSGVLYYVFLPAATLLHELPHSREHEIEADYIGVHLAAEACYDPRAAKKVFAAMKHDHEGHSSSLSSVSSKSSSQQPPEFLSTHPSYDTRLSNFDQWMPEAMVKYNAEDGLKCKRIREEMLRARQQAAILASQSEGQRRPYPPPQSSSY